MCLRFIAGLICCVLFGCEQNGGDVSETEVEPAEFVGATVCKDCHLDVYRQWENSHHDWAMAEPSDETVLGDFSDVSFRYGEVESRFFRRGDQFWVSTDGPDGETTEYAIAYTFGVEPLQQYLVAFPGGRLQALSIAWDARDREQGGQRWFHLYPNEVIDYQDPLHWTGPMHNWNHMCAECHSTQLVKNYQADSDTFATHWEELNVACEACHGPGSRHVALTKERGDLGSDGAILSLQSRGQWEIQSGTGVASLQSAGSTAELNVCARCHSRRSTLTSPHNPSDLFLDTHRPALLLPGLYHADGQIQDEVYVYGSFLQSKMFKAGVTCSDCHDPHSLNVKGTAQRVCANCHAPAKFDTPTHHHHDPSMATVGLC